jgi:sugar lactone lactonase YvrE
MRPLSFVFAAFGLCAFTACGSDEGPPGFDTPESVLYLPDADVWLCSNILGAPAAKDGNGYIARVQPDGTSMQRYWIRGGTNGVTLHAPKGMAVVDDTLWVADIDTVRAFDVRTGAPRGAVAIPGATFLNDVAAGPDGAVYVTDSGFTPEFAASGTDAIWRIAKDGTPTALVKTPDLGQPNGLVARDGGLYVASWRDGTIYQIDYRGTRTDLLKAPQAQLDGLLRLDGDGGGAWYVSSWAGKCIYRFDAKGGMVPLERSFEQPADFGFDSKRRRLLVPLFGANRVEVVPLP